MITVKRGGKTYEITDADQERVRALAVANGGNVGAAVAAQFEEKYGEPFGPPTQAQPLVQAGQGNCSEAAPSSSR